MFLERWGGFASVWLGVGRLIMRFFFWVGGYSLGEVRRSRRFPEGI